MYNQRSLAKYAGSSPINFRLIVANLLLIVGCSFVLVRSVSALSTAMGDMDLLTRKSAGAAPCGLSVPRVKSLLQAVREISDDAFTEEDEAVYVQRVQRSFCDSTSVTNALRAAFRTDTIPDDCCNADVDRANRTDINAAVKEYLCKCDSQGCNAGSQGYGDIVRRIAHAYALAAPAFARYVDSKESPSQSWCTRAYDPFSLDACPNEKARDVISEQIIAAAEHTTKILDNLEAPETNDVRTAEMMYRLLVLGVIEYHDRAFNDGHCFKNTDGSSSAIALCETKLASSSRRYIHTESAIQGCVEPDKRPYYVDLIQKTSSCAWSSEDGTEEDRTLEPAPRALRRFSEEYKIKPTVVAVCSSTLEFGLLDSARLFGIPDPVSKFEFYGSNHGNSFTRWLAGWAYYGLFDANVDQAVAEKHTSYLDLKLYTGYRLAATAAWTIAAICATGYLLAFASVPMAKLLYVRVVRRNLTNTATETIVLKPLGSAEYLALAVGLVVGLWVIFVDPGHFVHHYTNDQCDDYATHGGAFPSSESRARFGLVGLTLSLLCGGLLVYAVCCRRVPRRQRVMPLNPFPLWPMLIVIVGVLVAVIILAIRAGRDWWQTEAVDLNASDKKSTSDLEEILWAAFWVLLFLGLLMGVLNQRHIAANAVLEVPLGRPPLFAYIWAGAAFAFSAIAAVFVWPLFDCQLGIQVNRLVCGDGVNVGVRWNYFWGCIAFVLTVAAIAFVFFAAYRVLLRVPRKNDPATAAFAKAKAAEIQQLAARRFGLPGAPAAPLPAASAIGGVVSAAFVVSDEESETSRLVPQTIPLSKVVAR